MAAIWQSSCSVHVEFDLDRMQSELKLCSAFCSVVLPIKLLRVFITPLQASYILEVQTFGSCPANAMVTRLTAAGLRTQG